MKDKEFVDKNGYKSFIVMLRINMWSNLHDLYIRKSFSTKEFDIKKLVVINDTGYVADKAVYLAGLVKGFDNKSVLFSYFEKVFSKLNIRQWNIEFLSKEEKNGYCFSNKIKYIR